MIREKKNNLLLSKILWQTLCGLQSIKKFQRLNEVLQIIVLHFLAKMNTSHPFMCYK